MQLSLPRILSLIATFEAAYMAVTGVIHVVRLDTDFVGWALIPLFAVLWPALLGGGVYVLWLPKAGRIDAGRPC